jgi:hypothetical protein
MQNQPVGLYLGLDVQMKRACSYFVLDTNLGYVDSGWLPISSSKAICNKLGAIVSDLLNVGRGDIAIGIDAPRMGLDKAREFYWKKGGWRKKTSIDKGYGRHCEVVIKSLNIANPQWTPIAENAPPWMQLGNDHTANGTPRSFLPSSSPLAAENR